MNNRIRFLFLALVIFAAGFLVFDYNARLKTYAALARQKNKPVNSVAKQNQPEPAVDAKNMNMELEVLTELTGDAYEKRMKDISTSLTTENYESVAKTLLSGNTDIEKKAVAIDLLSRTKNEESKSILNQYIRSNLYQNSEADQLLKNQAQEALDHHEINR